MSNPNTNTTVLDARYDPLKVINAAAYGWATTATAAVNKTAFASALAAAQTQGKPLYLGTGTYQKTTGLPLKATATFSNGLEVFGSSRGNCIINVATDTAELIQVGGFNIFLHDFTVRHASDSPSSSTGSGLVFYKSAYSTFKRLQITNAGRGAEISQTNVNEPGTSSGSGNYMFSNTFEDFNVLRYSKNALFLNGYGGQSTGSAWTNVYLQNVSTSGTQLTSSGNAVDMYACDAVFDQLNIEDLTGTPAFLANAQSNVTINSLHLERVHLPAGYQHIQSYGGASIIVNGGSISYCNMAVSGTSGNTHHFDVRAGASLKIDGAFTAALNTISGGATYSFAEVGDTNAGNSLEVGYVLQNSNATMTMTNSTANTGLKRFGDTLYAIASPPVGKSCAMYYSGSNASLATFSAAQILYNTLDYNDDAAYFTPSTSSSSITIIKTGLYFVRAQTSMPVTSASKTIDAMIQFGGVTMAEHTTLTPTAANGSVITEVSKIVRVKTANTVVTGAMYLDTAASYGGSSMYNTRIEVSYIGS